MKQIFIRKENCNLKELMESLERETSILLRRNWKNMPPTTPMEHFHGFKNIITIITAQDDGLDSYSGAATGPTGYQEIHCMKDFVAAVKEQFPKKEEEFCVDLAFVDRKSLLEEIEKVSSALWFSNDKPTHCTTPNRYLEICKRVLFNTGTSENKTELTPALFIVKCAELCPPKSVYDYLKKGDVCLVRDNGFKQQWRTRFYAGDESFCDYDSDCRVKWEQVKPTGANVYDVLNDGPVTSHEDCF